MMEKSRKIHPHAAGIDIGSEKVFVAVEGLEVSNYRTFTIDFGRLVADLVANGVETVAMEATGVYWIALHDMIEQAGIEVFVVNSQHLRMVPGRKTDVQDCQWIQYLHSHGLLGRSMVPSSAMRELRLIARLRDDHIEDGARQVNKMHKALTLMNIRLGQVISQPNGKSGMRVIEAILAGERDAVVLSGLCGKAILKNKREQVVESLRGFYNDTHLFELKHAVECYKFHQQKISECDTRLEVMLGALTAQMPEPADLKKAKPIRHNAPDVEDLHKMVVKLGGGHDATVLPGITDYNCLKILAMIGGEIKRWPSEKHFTSWLGLAPRKSESGKSRRRSRQKVETEAGNIFKLAAHSLLASKNNALGAYARRLRARKGAPIAIKATARKLAEMFWRLLTHGIDYVEAGVKAYEEQRNKNTLNYLMKKAKELGLQLVENQHYA
jgi:transposase